MSKNQLAFHFAKQASEIGYPIGDVLFIEHRIYDYMIDYEISISAFWVEKIEIGAKSQRPSL